MYQLMNNKLKYVYGLYMCHQFPHTLKRKPDEPIQKSRRISTNQDVEEGRSKNGIVLAQEIISNKTSQNGKKTGHSTPSIHIRRRRLPQFLRQEGYQVGR